MTEWVLEAIGGGELKGSQKNSNGNRHTGGICSVEIFCEWILWSTIS